MALAYTQRGRGEVVAIINNTGSQIDFAGGGSLAANAQDFYVRTRWADALAQDPTVRTQIEAGDIIVLDTLAFMNSDYVNGNSAAGRFYERDEGQIITVRNTTAGTITANGVSIPAGQTRYWVRTAWATALKNDATIKTNIDSGDLFLESLNLQYWNARATKGNSRAGAQPVP